VLVHIVQAERGFFATDLYGLERARANDGRPLEMSEENWNAFWADAPFAMLSESGTFTEIQAYHAALHSRILRELAGVTAEELRLPIKFWENELMPLEFRLHRFDSHLRQHTVQAEKTLDNLGHPPSEAKRLLRMIYAALAGVEGVTIGAEATGAQACQSLAMEIARLTDEIVAILAE
jgi:hypothetical protein